ncbi:hypothetical protein [Methanolapillus africanus]|uniref:hypothetical protein n=1 Tax=Methanolapillus africanus TaxID=3028297 RepID=UPI0030B8F642
MKYVHERVYDREMISGSQLTRYYSIADQNCHRCGSSPHLILYNAYSIGSLRKTSDQCITCGGVDYCQKCKIYVPALIDLDNFSGAWSATGRRCPYCKNRI